MLKQIGCECAQKKKTEDFYFYFFSVLTKQTPKNCEAQLLNPKFKKYLKLVQLLKYSVGNL